MNSINVVFDFLQKAVQPENFLELATIVTIYFVFSRFGGFFTDNLFKKLKKWTDSRGWGDSIVMNYILIISQLMAVILLTFSIRLFANDFTLNWVSSDQTIFLQNAIGIVFAFIEFSTQDHLKDMLQSVKAHQDLAD